MEFDGNRLDWYSLRERKEGVNGWTLNDAGLNNASTRELLAEQLRGKEVTDLFITHYHPDHFGYAGGLQQKTKARVSMKKRMLRRILQSGQMPIYNKTCFKTIKNGLLSTDHISPKITPNISYWFHGDDNSLQSYLTSLEKNETAGRRLCHSFTLKTVLRSQ